MTHNFCRSHLSPSTPVHRCHPTTTPEMENSQSSSLPANINNAAIVATEVVAVSDESDLLSGGHANETDEVPMPIYQEIDSIKDDVGTIVEVHQPTAKISVVDCSQVIPVGFEIENRSSPSHSRTNSSISASSSPEVRRMKCSTPTRNKTTVKPLRFRQKPNEVNQPNESNRDGTTLKSYRIANYANSGFTDGPGRDDQTLVSRIVLSDPINEPIFSPRPAVLTNEKAKSQVAVQTVRFEPDPTVSSRV